MEFRVLGPIEVWDGERSVDLGPRMPRAVLALLVMDVGRVVSLDCLMDQLWGDEPPATATTALQGYISQLRRALEPNRAPRTPPRLLVTQSPGYVLRVEPKAVDALRFETLVGQGRDLLAGGQPEGARGVLRRALGLWRGAPYADFSFESFAQDAIVHLNELRAGAVELLAEADLALGEHAVAAIELERLVASEPLRERRWELLALALYRSGRQAEALRALDKARRTLAEDLGIEPGQALRQLEGDMLAQSPTLDWRAPAADAVPPLLAPRPAEPLREPPLRERIVGRDRELTELEEVVDRALSGQGTVVLVSGEPGIGKTRLVEETAASAAARGAVVAWGRGYEGEGSAPLWPWVEIIRTLAWSAEPELARDALAPGAAHIAQIVPEIKELLGDVDAPPLLTGEAARLGLYNAVIGFLVRVSAACPAFVIADDAHWMDVPSLHLIELLAERVADTPIVLTLTYRDGDVDADHPLTRTLARLGRRRARRVPLSGLGLAEVTEVITSITGREPGTDVAGVVHRRTEGNPLFVSELARLLHSEGRLGAGAQQKPTGPLDVPAGVRDVIRQRLRRLPDEAVALLRTAAVIGREFDLDVLVSAVDVDEERVFDGVEAGLLVGVLVESPTAPGRYRFSHGLVQETLYGELNALRRARLHRAIAVAILAARGDGGDQAIELAHHFWEARAIGAAEQALQYAEWAAELALARHAYEFVEEQVGRARQLVEQLPPGPERAAHELRLHLLLKKVLTITKGFATAELEDVAARARDIARELGDSRELVASLWGQWAFRCVGGHLDSARELAGQLLELGEHDDDLAFKLAGNYTLGVTAWHQGQQGMARIHLDRAIEICDRAPAALLSETFREYLPAISSRAFSALVLCLMDEQALADERTRAAVELARSSDDPYAITYALLFDAWCGVIRHEPQHTLRQSGEALAIAREHGLGLWLALGSILHGWARGVTGDPDSPVAEIRGALAGMEGAGARMLRHFALALVAESHWTAGEAEAALEAIQEGLAEAEAANERFYEPELLRLRGEILGRSPDCAREAQDALQRAVDLARTQHAGLLERRATGTLEALKVGR